MKQQTYEFFAELTAKEWADAGGENWNDLDKSQRRLWKQRVKAAPEFQKWASDFASALTNTSRAR